MARAFFFLLMLTSAPAAASLTAEGHDSEQQAVDLAQERAEQEGPPGGSAPTFDAPAGTGAADSNDMGLDLDRWVMHDVLEHGPGQTLDANAAPSAASEDAGHAHFTHEPDDWQQRVAKKRAALALRGEPQQRRNVQQASARFDIPVRNHPLVDLYIDYFTGRGRWFFARWLDRSTAMVPLMQEILAAHGLPKDLVYLAMIESGFSPHATSFAAASGYWQFMPSTGALFGLRQDRFVDERRDFIAATQAAVRFLDSLHRHFHGDWHLAWASYNAGEHRIRRAMAKTGATTFWDLIDRPHGLAKETVHYVPKIIAAAIVAKDAERYGFRVQQQPPVVYEQVSVDGALDVRLLAKRMNVAIEPLRALNPALLYDITPPNRRTRLRVPVGTAQQTEWALARLPRSERLEYVAYRVRKGDTLSGIAKRMHASLDNLKQFNRLSSSRVRLGQELLVPSALVGAANKVPLGARSKPARSRRNPIVKANVQARRPSILLTRSNKTQPKKVSGRAPKARHIVASGDTLWSIARRYGVTQGAVSRRGRPATPHLAVGDVVDIF